MTGKNKAQTGNNEKELLENELKGTRRIHSQRIDPRGKPPAPKPRFSRQHCPETVTEGVVVYEQTPAHGADEIISYTAPGPQRKVIKKLRLGQIPREASLDLHRMTLADAAQTVHDFILEAVTAGCRCIRIVHGKGSRSRRGPPKMKNQLALWLRRHDDVLAYCSALPRDGGTGAVYVLLRRR